jgi:hypothetical protein
MSEKRELKETLELVKALDLLASKGIEISKGGIGAEDIAPAVELLKQLNVLIEGFKGVGEVGAELGDLDDTELLQLGSAVYGVYKDIKGALAKPVVA